MVIEMGNLRLLRFRGTGDKNRVSKDSPGSGVDAGLAYSCSGFEDADRMR
jgi:hypothetical protein